MSGLWEIIWRWETLWWILFALYVPACIGLVIIVLLQKAKGVGFAGAFGVGPGSETIFGPRGSRSVPIKITYAMAGIFMLMAFSMSLLSGKLGHGVAPETVEVQEPGTAGIEDLEKMGLGSQSPASTSVTPVQTPTAPLPDAAEAAPSATPEVPAEAPPAPETGSTPEVPAPSGDAGQNATAAPVEGSDHPQEPPAEPSAPQPSTN
ncbi:MAG: preprotein translocase subunit SecG [Candidatus Hydrogenedentes bacterium]|nr:preprotein translocase subunit SecG [Candidatus Hydrogenedentota bacterium]